MSALLSFRDDNGGRFANVRMDNGDPLFISVSQQGVLAKKSKLGIFGAKLYDERDIFRAAMTGKALAYLFPQTMASAAITNPILRAFANAALHCQSLAQVTSVFNTAIGEAEAKSGLSIDKLPL